MAAANPPTLQDVISDDLNYEIWAPIMKTSLAEKRLWDVVKYGILPDLSKIPELATKIQAEDLSIYREFVAKDTKALHILQSSLPDSVFRETLKATSAKHLWDLLKEADVQAKLEKKKLPDVQAKLEKKKLPEYQMLAINVGHLTFDEDMWMVYTTTTNHMTPYVKYFTNLDRTNRAKIRSIIGSIIMSEGMGDVRIMTKEGHKTIKNVLYVPAINRNVLSVPQMTRIGYRVLIDAGNLKCTVKDQAGRLFAETLWDDKRCFYMRLQVVEGDTKMIMKGDFSSARKPNLQDIISDDLNIEVWSAMMKTILMEKGVWNVVENGVPPDPSKIPELAAKIQAEELCNWRELVREDLKALQLLQSSLPDSVFRKTLSAASAKELWGMVNEVPDHVAECFVGNFGFHWNIWLISSINSNHMTPHERFFTTLDKSKKAKVKFISGDKSKTTMVMAEGIGDVTFITKDGNQTIKNVLYVPGINGNALSVSQMEKSGFGVAFDEKRCTIWNQKTGKCFGKTMWENRGYCLRWDVVGR